MIHEVTGFEQIHLHTTEGSLLDGFGFVKEYAQHWKSHGKYLCITDHGMMSAIPNQIKECDKNGLTPLFGCELYVNPLQIQYATDKEFKDYQKTLDPEQMKLLRRSFHLLAIAHSNVGYSNLVTLTSLAWTKGFYYRPRVNHELLKQYKEGITFTSCCYMSEVGQAFDKGGDEAGFAMIEKYIAMFGKHYKLEFMLLDFVKQKPYNQFIMKAREKYDLPIIVTNDCHYCKQEDSLNQRLMLMVQTKNTIGNMERKIQESGSQDFFELQDANLWMKTEDEMNAKWESSYSDVIDYEIFKQAKRTTVEICQMAGGLKLDRSMKFPQIDHANEKLKELTLKGFKKRNLSTSVAYKKRLQEEFELIFSKGFSSYFLVLKTAVDEARRYSLEVFGEPNAIGPGRGSAVGSLVCYCLGITNVDPIKHDLLFSRFLSKARNDYPDVDLDFIPEVRDYLKNEWAPKYFGTEYVTNIGSYNRFGIKGSLQDMARVYDQDHHEITALTKKLGLKDDEGDALTWDKAMVMYPELKAYCDTHEDVAKASKKMLNRSRSMGKHAGGIIISSVPINKFVPLVKGKEGEVVSAWTEGLHDQELGPMGFIKYDWLVITNLVQINYACKIIKERHGLKSICAKPGQEDFSDDSFIEDEKALAIANEGDLKCIFQFDSDGIRNLVKKGGVDCFNDLVAYASLYRPGPMSEGMHDEYCLRKRGEKEYTIHPLLATKGDLQKTYGVISYQEQCMKILHVVGDIPLEDCEILRKAISKKKEEYFAEYKVKFLENGVKNLGWPVEEVENLWNQIEAFAGYAFNLCLVGDTKVYESDGSVILIEDIYKKYHRGEEVYVQSLGEDGLMTAEKVVDALDNGNQNIFRLKLTTGQTIKATENHKFLTNNGWKTLGHLSKEDWIATPNKIMCLQIDFPIEDYKITCLGYFLAEGNTCHPSSLYFYNNDLTLINDFVSNAALFGESHITINRKKSGNYYATINSGHKGDCRNYKKTNILEWSNKINIRFQNAKKKTLPQMVYYFSERQISLLLAKMWEGDGCIDANKAYYATSSKTLADQVQSLLLRINITSTLGRKKFKYKGSYKIGYTVNLHGENWIRKFKNSIGKFIISKTNAMNFMVENPKNYDLIPYSFFQLIRSEIKLSGNTCKYVADKSGLSTKLFVFNKKKKGFTRETIRKIAIVINSNKLLELANSNVYWSKIKSIRKSGVEKTYDITVNKTHNFVANNIISHNSHACAYTYISSMLLWLKAHYPLEFFTAVLHFEKDSDKIKEYRLDARRHDIRIQPLDLNKSKLKFDIVDDQIYIGFSNIKGIGEPMAEKIVANQPYKSFSDFLHRCGADESVLKPLIGLRVFKDAKVDKLYTYYKWYRGIRDKRLQRKKRFEATCEKNIESVKELGYMVQDHNEIVNLEGNEELQALVKKHNRCIQNYYKRSTLEEEIPGLDNFVLLPDDEQPEMDEKLLNLYLNPVKCEVEFYGFIWHHPICKSVDYEGNKTFDNLRYKQVKVGRVEVLINSVAKTASKKGNVYWLLKIEDENGEEVMCQVWEDDWDRFKDDLVAGQLVKMEVKCPDGGFNRYSLNGPLKWRREYDLPKTRKADFRVFVLAKPEISD